MARTKKQQPEESKGGAPEWMVTYSDLVTLLLTFFILLFSMAQLDKKKFDEISFSLKSALMHKANGEMFNVNKGQEFIKITAQTNPFNSGRLEVNDEDFKREQSESKIIDMAKEIKEKKLEEVKKQIEEAIVELKLNDFVKVIEEKNSLILRIDSVILFDLGRAQVKDSGRDILKELGELFKKLDHEIVVQGHTDNLPINTAMFPTNWELSTKRATNVVLFLVKECSLDPSKLTATGSGEHKPIASNETPEGRQKNRRIDVVIEK